MARKYQEGEKMQTCAVRMGASMLARIDAYGARLKAQHPGLRVERADAVRDLMLKALALVEENGPAGPDTAESGPVLAVGQDLSPHGQDQSATPTAQRQDQQRTTGRKRTAAKG
jgi:hypothetical protein